MSQNLLTESKNESVSEKIVSPMNVNQDIVKIELLKLNAALQKKKNAARSMLHKMGMIEPKGYNKHSEYPYITESQYKDIMIELLSASGIEFHADVMGIENYEGTKNLPYGRRVHMRFKLIDIDTGFSEESNFIGEGVDNQDKALYKAYTGALKYYVAETFHIPSGVEAESENDQPKEPEGPKMIAQYQRTIIEKYYTGDDMGKLLKSRGVESLDEMTFDVAKGVVDKLMEINKKKDIVKEASNESDT